MSPKRSPKRRIAALRLLPDGVGADSLLMHGLVDEALVSPDGAWLVIRAGANGSVAGGRDITGIRLGVDTAHVPLIVTNTNGFKHHVSNGGATAPLWSRDGRELFVVSTSRNMMSARVTDGSPLSIGAPVSLFHIADDLLRVEYTFYTPWDVAADGRFIMARSRRTRADYMSTVVVAENWLSELRAKMKH